MSVVTITASSSGLPEFCRRSTESEWEAVGCVALHWGAAIATLLILAGVAYGGYCLYRWLRRWQRARP